MPQIINRNDSRVWTCTYCWTQYETTGAEVLRLETACPDCGHQPEVQVPMGWVAEVLAEWEPSAVGTSIRVVLGRFHEAATAMRESDESSRTMYFSDAALLRCIALAGIKVDPKEGKVYMVRRKTTRTSFPEPTQPHTVDLPTKVVVMVDGRPALRMPLTRAETIGPPQGVSPSTLHCLFNFIQLQGGLGYIIQRAHRSFFQDYFGHEPAWEIELEAAEVIKRGKGDSESSLLSESEIELDVIRAKGLLTKHGL